MFSFENQVCLITGAGSPTGIGFATAKDLGLLGGKIYMIATSDRIFERANELKELGIEGEWTGIGHCAVGYIDGEIPEAAARKDGRVYWVE